MAYEVVRNNCTSDSLLCAKLKFFNSVAKQISPFLTLYRTDKPMAPFISSDLYKLLKALMKRFVKPNVMKDLTSAAKVSAVEVSSLKSESLLDYSKIDIGFEAETAVKQALQEKKATDKNILEFRLDCRKWLTTVVCKLLDKTAVQYTLARNLAFLDPRKITECETNQSRLKSVLRQLVQFNRVATTDIDDILHQFRIMLTV